MNIISLTHRFTQKNPPTLIQAAVLNAIELLWISWKHKSVNDNNDTLNFFCACWCSALLSDICFTKVITILENGPRHTKHYNKILDKLAKVFDRVVNYNELAETLQYHIPLSPNWYKLVSFGKSKLLQLIQDAAKKYNVDVVSITRVYDRPLYLVSCKRDTPNEQLQAYREELNDKIFIQIQYDIVPEIKEYL